MPSTAINYSQSSYKLFSNASYIYINAVIAECITFAQYNKILNKQLLYSKLILLFLHHFIKNWLEFEK